MRRHLRRVDGSFQGPRHAVGIASERPATMLADGVGSMILD